MLKTIYLMRHAEPDFLFDEDLLLGQKTDRPLSGEGKRSAKALAVKLDEIVREAGMIYVSPLRRAKQTAFELCVYSGVPMNVISSLTEMDAGSWDGKSFAQIKEEYPDLYEKWEADHSVKAPGGESWQHAADRAEATITTLAKVSKADSLVLVSHFALNRALLCKLSGIPFSENNTIPQDYLAINTLVYDTEADTLSVEKIGEVL